MARKTAESVQDVQREVEAFRADFARIEAEVARVIVGLENVVRDVLTALFCGGSVLLEGVPGVGKTRLVRSLGDALQLDFGRIQCTPDLMPADILGTNIILSDEDGRRTISFQRGPVFTNLLLVDEINRATPKTQSALLEAMQEHRVTVAGETRRLSEPFFVVATQNPIEMEGTYPLPEAQLDRFLFKLLFPCPSAEQLCEISRRTTSETEPRAGPVVDGRRLQDMQATVRKVAVAPHVERFASGIVVRTHPQNPESPPEVRRFVQYGASPRGMQALILGAKVRALLDARPSISRDDIDTVVHQALRHRLIRTFEGEAEGVPADAIVDAVLASVREPAESA